MLPEEAVGMHLKFLLMNGLNCLMADLCMNYQAEGELVWMCRLVKCASAKKAGL